MKELKGKNILLLGYGKENQSVHRFLSGATDLNISIADNNQVTAIRHVNNVYTGDNYLEHLHQFDTIVRSPGISQDLPQLVKAKNTGIHITSATNIFFAESPGKIVAVTGTKGKSTTSSLIYQILKQQFPDVRFVGNIGRPALDHLKGANAGTIFVIELSSFQLEDLKYAPYVAAILNFYPEHLDHYGSVYKYWKAKQKIVMRQTEKDYVVFNQNQPYVLKMIKRANSRKLCYGLSPRDHAVCFVERGFIKVRSNYLSVIASGRSVDPRNDKGEEPVKIINVEEIPLLGIANLENVLAAATAGLIFNVKYELISQAVKEFVPLFHRLEFVGEYKGIGFYNDSLATVPQATMHALEALGQNVETLIVGGLDRGVSYTNLGKYIAQSGTLKTILLFPETGKKVWQAVEKASPSFSKKISHFEVSDMKETVRIAFENTHIGKICLLSPAAASFNLFKDYKERGDSFKKEIIIQSKS